MGLSGRKRAISVAVSPGAAWRRGVWHGGGVSGMGAGHPAWGGASGMGWGLWHGGQWLFHLREDQRTTSPWEHLSRAMESTGCDRCTIYHHP